MILRELTVEFKSFLSKLIYISCQLRLARKKRWNIQEEKRIAQEIELQSYLNRLIKEDMENRIQKLSLDDTIDDEAKKEAEGEIQDKCVSLTCC